MDTYKLYYYAPTLAKGVITCEAKRNANDEFARLRKQYAVISILAETIDEQGLIIKANEYGPKQNWTIIKHELGIYPEYEEDDREREGSQAVCVVKLDLSTGTRKELEEIPEEFIPFYVSGAVKEPGYGTEYIYLFEKYFY